MGDRCYMSVTCRRIDQDQFATLGFQIDFDIDPASPIVEMIDDEANYGHYDEMPTNIPYTAQYSSGSNYGPGSIACDGKQFEEISATTEGFVLDWNYLWNLPKIRSILKARRFINIERRVVKEFNALRKAAANSTCSARTTAERQPE